MSLLEGHADVVMDGVGPAVIPSVAEIRRKFDQRRKGVGTLDRLLRRLLGLDAKMAQYRDGAQFVRGSSTRSAWTGSTRSGTSPPTCRPRPRSPTRPPGSRRVHAEPRWARTRPSRPCASPSAARSPTLDPGDPRVLVACSGGADSLALLAATVFEARKPAADAWSGVTVDHGLQEGSAEHADRVVAQMARLGAAETADASGSPSTPGGRGPEAAAREARYAVLAEIARAVRRRARCCSGTRSTTRRRPSCSG